MSITPLLHVQLSPAMSKADTDRLHWSQHFAICTLHEATLQTLLGTRNYTVLQLLSKCNNLLHEWYLALGSLFLVTLLSHPHLLFFNWRVLLGGPDIEYSDTEFITLSDPDALLPYIITLSGIIVPFRSGQPSGGYHPGAVRISHYVCGYETHTCTGLA